MATRPDFFLYDRIGRLAAVVEVKNRRGTSSQWAAELRRDLLAHFETFRGAPIFVLVTPDRVYLWKNAPTDLQEDTPPAPPDYEVDAVQVFGPYLERPSRRLSLEEISRPALELVVMSWLGDLIRQTPEARGSGGLEGSGLREAARDGRIADPLAA
jgi:hypothetical protein